MQPAVYKISFPDSSAYVGATCHLQNRIRNHIREAGSVNKKLAAAFAQHPACCIEHLACGLSRSTLHLLEAQLIEQHKADLNFVTAPTKIGQRYKVSHSQMAEKYGVKVGTYFLRRSSGWTIHEALGIKPRTPPNWKRIVKKRMITVDGVTRSLNGWASAMKIPPGRIHSRLGVGWTEAQAVGLAPAPSEIKAAAKPKRTPRVSKIYTIDGVTGTLSEICKLKGFPYSVASSRRTLGWEEKHWFLPKGTYLCNI